jgi:DNA-binding transcriptional regulator YiaG
VPDDVDPRAVRLSLRVNQQCFADRIGVSVRTVQAWERIKWTHTPGEGWKAGRRKPDACARVLLAVVAKYPWVIFDALNDQLPASVRE